MKNKSAFIFVFILSFTSGLIFAQEEEQIQSGPVPVREQGSPASKLPVSKTGEQGKISLDIKGMDVVDVLKMLAQRSGMNIVIGKNVTGRVTLLLKDVDIQDAFEIVLLANDLAYETKGQIVNVMTQRDYELLYGERFKDKKQLKVVQLKYVRAAEISKALNQIKTNVGRIVVDDGSNTVVLMDSPEKIKEMEDFIRDADLPLQTRIFSLNYAQAEKLSPKLQEVVTKGVGVIKIDERTNKIAVTDFVQKLDEITKIISAFDEKAPQVLIDAQIIEINPSDAFRMGVDWDYWLEKNVRLLESLPTTGGTNILKIGMSAKNTLALSEQGQYKGVIDLLRTIGDTQILSSPRITVINNQEAKILIGTKEVYVSQTTSQSGAGPQVTADQVNFVDVGIKLYVTPSINSDDFITMKIRPEISSVSSFYEYGTPVRKIPIVATSEAETTVTIKDGVTLIIGGLRRDNKADNVSKIPLIGDIPLIGHLFRRTSHDLQKTELVILLTPHIITGETPYTDLSEPNPKEGARARMTRRKIVKDKFSSSKQDIALNPQEKGAADYYQSLINKINRFARLSKPKGKKGEVALNFKLYPSGELAGQPVVVNTTNPYLNVFAINAIKDASPFGTLPQELQRPGGTFKVSLSYE